MGLLDDAIREHLDLKRRRGADPAEVERAEREALGPVRRHPDDAATPDLVDEAPGAMDDVAYEEDFEHDWHEPLAEPPAEETYPLPPESSAGPPSTADARWEEHGAAFADDQIPTQDPMDRAPAPPPADPLTPPPHPAHRLPEETAEYNVELEHHGEATDEDVLEETPEFLQDTPDHDRLWFEQRPPRDFDFDG